MRDYKNYFIIPAPAADIYRALTNPATISLWSGDQAKMSTEKGSEFSLYGGNIVGRNLEFEDGRKIVQHWYFGVQEEPSIVSLVLHPHKKGTSIELKHTNIPDSDFEDIVEGWNDTYFQDIYEFYS